MTSIHIKLYTVMRRKIPSDSNPILAQVLDADTAIIKAYEHSDKTHGMIIYETNLTDTLAPTFSAKYHLDGYGAWLDSTRGNDKLTHIYNEVKLKYEEEEAKKKEIKVQKWIFECCGRYTKRKKWLSVFKCLGVKYPRSNLMGMDEKEKEHYLATILVDNGHYYTYGFDTEYNSYMKAISIKSKETRERNWLQNIQRAEKRHKERHEYDSDDDDDE